MAEKTRIPARRSSSRKSVGVAPAIKRPSGPAKSARKAASAEREPRLTLEPQPLTLDQRKFVLEPAQLPPAPSAPAYEYLGELPEAYGTKRLFLTARDPHWLFAYWDLTWQQFQEAAHAAHDGKVFLQLYTSSGERVQQIQINESAKNWYLQVGQADASFYAELGYYKADGGFEVLGRSGTTTTPRDTLSWRTQSRFATIPMSWTFSQLFEFIAAYMQDGEDLADALARLQEEGFDFPFARGSRAGLSEEQHNELLGYLSGDFSRRLWVGSFEITESLRQRFRELVSSGAWMGGSIGGSEMSSRMGMGSQWVTSFGVSSPFGASFGAAQRARQFFMHVNAELIIYGGTDPKAKVRVDGQEIALREDGTFSYHFTFPDGRFFIPIEATSPDGVETRSAMLSFMRITDRVGDVTNTPQPPLDEPLGRIED